MAKIHVKNRLPNVTTLLPGQRKSITNDAVVEVEKTKEVVSHLNLNRLVEVDAKDVPKAEAVKASEKAKEPADTDKKGK